MKLDPMTIFMWLAALLPALAMFAWVTLESRRQRKTEKPPQSEKLLRPAGHSLSLRLDLLQEALLIRFLLPCGFCAFAGVSAGLLGTLLGWNAPAVWIIGSAVVFVAFVIAGIVALFSAMRLYREFHNVRLGLRGEQAVAETLHEVADAGFRVFHDVPGGENWNIDHVAIGSRGFFVIETKARSRRASRNGKPEHVITYDGKALHFPSGDDLKAIPQAERNARWLEDYLTKRTGEPVKAQPVVAIPGWYVETGGNFPVKVMNAEYLKKYLRSASGNIEPAQVRRIIAALDDKCRDMEF
jgi:hypothetical protein